MAEKGKKRSGAAKRSQVSGAAAPTRDGRMSRQRKWDVVLRLLQSGDLETGCVRCAPPHQCLLDRRDVLPGLLIQLLWLTLGAYAIGTRASCSPTCRPRWRRAILACWRLAAAGAVRRQLHAGRQGSVLG
jgi:hypothetical protein